MLNFDATINNQLTFLLKYFIKDILALGYQSDSYLSSNAYRHGENNFPIISPKSSLLNKRVPCSHQHKKHSEKALTTLSIRKIFHEQLRCFTLQADVLLLVRHWQYIAVHQRLGRRCLQVVSRDEW